jgi:DNA-binding MarR family transcriptional regulator
MSENVADRQHAVNIERASDARTPEGDAFTELVVHVFRLNGSLVAAGDALAKPAGQTSARWKVLAAIEDGPATVAQIARVFGLARQSVQRVADLLVEDGLAEYKDNPRHRRAKLVNLTPAGRSVIGTIQAAQRQWSNQLGAEIGEEELRNGAAVLARVMEAVESAPAPRE